MKKLFAKLGFIRVPLQLAAGLYMAVMLVFGTAAALVHFDDEHDQCGELERQIILSRQLFLKCSKI